MGIGNGWSVIVVVVVIVAHGIANGTGTVVGHVTTNLKIGVHFINVPNLTMGGTKGQDQHGISKLAVCFCVLIVMVNAGTGPSVTHAQHVVLQLVPCQDRVMTMSHFMKHLQQIRRRILIILPNPTIVIVMIIRFVVVIYGGNVEAIDFVFFTSPLKRTRRGGIALIHVMIDNGETHFTLFFEHKRRKGLQRLCHGSFPFALWFQHINSHAIHFPFHHISFRPHDTSFLFPSSLESRSSPTYGSLCCCCCCCCDRLSWIIVIVRGIGSLMLRSRHDDHADDNKRMHGSRTVKRRALLIGARSEYRKERSLGGKITGRVKISLPVA
eukprot:scaffold289947_cov51-Attheya_sp.AAC.1